MDWSSIGGIVFGVFVFLFVFRKEIRGHYEYRRWKKMVLPDPFCAEVMYEGAVVATITDRQWVEMFWASYAISPVDGDSEELISNDRLWDECKFYFRDPETGRICTLGHVGGHAPFIRDSRILLRALYFEDQNSASA